VPSGLQSSGLPTGITFMAPAGSDADLCRLGSRFHQQTPGTLGATEYSLPR
jgi:allophanate hydrolase